MYKWIYTSVSFTRPASNLIKSRFDVAMPSIRQIVISGFKSYKDQTVIEPFSAKHNVVGTFTSSIWWI